MNSYEMVDPNTGEMIEFETTVDIALIQDYNRWVVENKINPPQFSPIEYAKYVEDEKRKVNVESAIKLIEFYNKEVLWEPEMVDSILRILRNEE